MKKLFSLTLLIIGIAHADVNQTDTISPIFPESSLPFRVSIEQADFSLPAGIHSGAFGSHQGKWLFIAGRTNGLHGFNDNTNNFPPEEQNQTVYVVDPVKKRVFSRGLSDPSSDLNARQIDFLSVTSPQFFQEGETLYITGGYGVDSSTGLFSTKPVLTAIDLPSLIHWVVKGKGSASHCIEQYIDPQFQVTGGLMGRIDDHPFLLIFGQNFQGYYVPGSNGDYTRQVRRFKIKENCHLSAVFLKPKPVLPDPAYRRRDLNVVPMLFYKSKGWEAGWVALSGVFTEQGGIWTIPIEIDKNGKSTMASPLDPQAFRQGMNNYTSAAFGLFSRKEKTVYTVLLGGITFGYFDNGVFQTDYLFPFTNQVTTVSRNHKGQYRQYFMSAAYPLILSTASNPGNPLLFGAGAQFVPNPDLKTTENGLYTLDCLCGRVLAGYIVGGIQSTLPNTNTESDTAASPYIFKVYLKAYR
ncbi:MAG: hypothetical protein LW832_11110 [Parachlamydia sp.]|nr:hypothetical protein [Parachlamydia sp.]